MPLPEARFAVLMFTDIVDSTGLKPAHGVSAYMEAFARHNALFEEIARGFPAMQILQHTGDGFFASFGGVADAVRFALLFQHAMRREKWPGLALTTRVGIHAGEVAATEVLGQTNAGGAAGERGAGHALPPHPPPLGARVTATPALSRCGVRTTYDEVGIGVGAWQLRAMSTITIPLPDEDLDFLRT